ncbi:MAG TPA: glycoside hydrolase family 25 protein [Thermoleophilaceae bacterium]|jgi:lysozyme
MPALKGVDVSQHQPSVDWEKVARSGVDFAIVKCSEGGDFIDPVDLPKTAPDADKLRRLVARCSKIREQRMTLGVYHLLRPKPGRTGDVEAEFAVKIGRKVGWGRPGDLRLFVDIELTELGAAATHRYIGQFVRRAKALTGHMPVIYTFPAFWTQLGNPGNFRCPLWIAHFGVAQPDVPAPWRKYTIWQHSSQGSVPGIPNHVDLDKAKRLPLIQRPAAQPVSAPVTAPEPTPVPVPVLTMRERLIARMRRARAKFLATGSDSALRVMLVCKARLGRWDPRYLMFFGPPGDRITDDVKRYITRGYARGLVPTSTTNGGHASGSLHFQGRAADMGLRTPLIGTEKGLRRMERFQRAEFGRRLQTRAVELIGPINDLVVLRGLVQPLAEGAALENQHDNHVHGAF